MSPRTRGAVFVPFLGLCCLPPCCCCSPPSSDLRAWKPISGPSHFDNLASTTALCVASSASVRWTCTKTCRSCVRTGTRSWCSRTKVATSSAFPSWMMKPPRHVSRTPGASLFRAQRRPIPVYPSPGCRNYGIASTPTYACDSAADTCRSVSSAYAVERIARPLLALLPLPTAIPRLTTRTIAPLYLPSPTLTFPWMSHPHPALSHTHPHNHLPSDGEEEDHL